MPCHSKQDGTVPPGDALPSLKITLLSVERKYDPDMEYDVMVGSPREHLELTAQSREDQNYI
jgi:hypothetical protein